MDLDADGTRDILSGCYSQSGHKVMVGVLWLLRGDKDGGFEQPAGLKGTDGKTLMVHHAFSDRSEQLTDNICTKPFACDWDCDGDLDLVVGNFKGTFFVFTGQGKGAFDPKPAPLTSADGKVLKAAGLHSDPFVIDWDGDGDLDLLATSHTGEIQWAENGAAKGAPQLSGFKRLIAKAKPGKGPAGSTRMWVEDFNGDGALDILVGDKVKIDGKATGQVWLYLQKRNLKK